MMIALFWGQVAAADATFVGRYVWTERSDAFGGLSGLSLSENGVDFIAISDRAHSVKGQFQRTNGEITGVTATPFTPLLGLEGGRMSGLGADPEGLAMASDGTAFVSFEGVARVWHYPDLGAAPQALPRHPDFARMQMNSALEALAIGADGALYTIPERSGRSNRPFPVYRYVAGRWDIPARLPRHGPHLIVGADIGPDARLYVLERDFTGIGFRTRVRRFALDGSGEETLIDTSNATHDNLEGISVWQAEDGLRITMISDDNFRFYQHTEIVEYRISD